jgi:O-antigen ligase
LIGLAGAFLSTLAIVFTGSRGGLLAALVGFVVVLVSCRRRPDARSMVRRVTLAILASAGAIVVITATGTVISPGGAVARLTSSDAIKRIFTVQNGSSGRLDIWRAGQLACEEYCGVGAGLGNFPDAYNQAFVFSGATKNVGANRPAHNIYLEMAVDAGVPGLVLLVLALLAEWRAIGGPGVRQVEPALKGVLVSILVANFFLSAIWFKYFFLVFVLVRIAEAATEDARSTPMTGPWPRWRAASIDKQHGAPVQVGSHA